MTEITIPYQFFCANSYHKLKELPDNSIDSCVTDSPYGLGKEPDSIKMLEAWITTGYLEVKGKGFMNAEWDSFVPQPLLWKEVFRVLKPGGYLLSFFGTRTYDWGTMAIRIGGFEIRDCIAWVYGTGFPKNHDVSKAIDSYLDVDSLREFKNKNPADRPYNHNVGHTSTGWESPIRPDKTSPYSIEAQQYEGYGTALKPAMELVCVARKPLEGTIAENVLKYGTGCINIDGCRIETDEDIKGGSGGLLSHQRDNKEYPDDNKYIPNKTGRWPANIISDGSEEVLSYFPDAKGQQGQLKNDLSESTNIIYGKRKVFNNGSLEPRIENSTSAARFFYCVKPSTSERDFGLENFIPKKVNDGRETEIDNPFQRGETERKNTHPTVKPIELMRYLIKLVTPTAIKGYKPVVLDPFVGSGTTGIAAMFEDVEFIGIDLEQDNIDLSEARVKAWIGKIEDDKKHQALIDSQLKMF